MPPTSPFRLFFRCFGARCLGFARPPLARSSTALTLPINSSSVSSSLFILRTGAGSLCSITLTCLLAGPSAASGQTCRPVSSSMNPPFRIVFNTDLVADHAKGITTGAASRPAPTATPSHRSPLRSEIPNCHVQRLLLAVLERTKRLLFCFLFPCLLSLVTCYLLRLVLAASADSPFFFEEFSDTSTNFASIKCQGLASSALVAKRPADLFSARATLRSVTRAGRPA